MAFSMIDDDFLPLDGYTPTVFTNSRAGNMRKPSKRQQPVKNTNTVSGTNQVKKVQTKKVDLKDQFDDLLEQLLEKDDRYQKKQAKKPTNNSSYDKQKSTTQQNFGYSNKDSFKFSNDSLGMQKQKFTLDEKTLTKPPTIFNQPSTFNLNLKKQTFSLNDDNIIQDDYKKNQQPRKRQSINFLNTKKQQPTNMFKNSITSLNNEDDLQINILGSRQMKPPIGRNRGNTNLSASQNTTINNNQNNNFNIDLDQIYNSKNDNKKKDDEPLTTNIFNQKSKQLISYPSKQNKNQQNKSIAQTPKVTAQSNLNIPNNNINNNNNNNNSKTIIVPNVDITTQLNKVREQCSKQLAFTKQTYQRQIKFITQSFQKQLKQERDTKERIMRDFRNLAETQKIRYQKMLNSQIQRIKQMSKWEKQKVQNIYTTQIKSLKNLLQQGKNNGNSYNNSSSAQYQKRRLQEVEERLKILQSNLEIQKRNIKRQQDELEDRQSSFKKYKQTQQQRIRQQYIKLKERENKQMKKMSQLMRNLYQQKQKMAMQFANLQIQINQKRQQIDYKFNQLHLQKQSFQQHKRELQQFNAKIFAQIKQKLQQAQNSKRHCLSLQNDLVNKLRIVEIRQKQIVIQDKKTLPTRTKQDNWVKDTRNLKDKSKQRFKKIENYVNNASINSNNNSNNNNMNTIQQSSSKSKFTLQDFMLNVDKYAKTRQAYQS